MMGDGVVVVGAGADVGVEDERELSAIIKTVPSRPLNFLC
jgi:hypothetical protein